MAWLDLQIVRMCDNMKITQLPNCALSLLVHFEDGCTLVHFEDSSRFAHFVALCNLTICGTFAWRNRRGNSLFVNLPVD